MSEENSNDQFEMQLRADESDHGVRLDVVLARHLPDYSRSLLQNWIRSGYVSIDEITCMKPRRLLVMDECVHIKAFFSVSVQAEPQALSLDIIAEDNHLLVVNKAAGMVVHPGAGNPDQTLMNALLYHCPSLSTLPRAGIIHRLDKDTSGLLVIPKTAQAHHHLVKQLQKRTMSRQYIALTKGKLIAGKTIQAAIGRHPRNRTRMAVVDDGKSATTHFRVNTRFEHHTLLDCQLETGRTHQIRVHCEWMGFPIVGDPLYGKRCALPKGISAELAMAIRAFQRQALHAATLVFQHPSTEEQQTFHAPIPDDMEKLIEMMHTHDAREV